MSVCRQVGDFYQCMDRGFLSRDFILKDCFTNVEFFSSYRF